MAYDPNPPSLEDIAFVFGAMCFGAIFMILAACSGLWALGIIE